MYFNPYLAQGQGIKSFTRNELRLLLKTRFKLPESIRLIDGIISSSSFIDAAFVERMFEGSSILFFNLVRNWNLESTVRENHGQIVSDVYTDEEVQREITILCQSALKADTPAHLDRKALAWLVRKVHSRFGCPRSQLLRLLPVDNFFLDRIL